jgi:hypothetical protein
MGKYLQTHADKVQGLNIYLQRCDNKQQHPSAASETFTYPIQLAVNIPSYQMAFPFYNRLISDRQVTKDDSSLLYIHRVSSRDSEK